jgi:hypothetical protein
MTQRRFTAGLPAVAWDASSAVLRRVLMLGAFLAFLAPAVQAAEPRKLAVLSMMGDTISLVQHHPQVGTRLDTNRSEAKVLPEPVFDRLALATLDDILKTPALAPTYTLGEMMVLPRKDSAAMLTREQFGASSEWLEKLAATGATHLLVLHAARAPAALQLRNQTVGTGYLEGLGFYVDRGIKVRRADTGEVGQGFLGVYVYLNAALVELPSGRILRERPVKASASFSSARNGESFDPLDALTAEQKVATFQRLLRGELRRVLPELLALP